jgi:tripartite-type tricarboxylate transporter receptor subunit TctC
MTRTRKNHFIGGMLACALASPALAQQAAAQGYPNRPVTIVLPFGPGSGTDLAGRFLAQRLSESLGRPVPIENKPGANGSIAATHVANARPDGHTLFIGTNSTHGANPALQKEMTYDPIRNFAPITRIAVFSSIIVVNPKVPVTTLQQLIAYGRENELTLATGNASGVVMGETLARAVGWKVLRVPYKSNPQAMQDLVAGRVSMMFSDIASSLGQINAGALRPVAITSRARSSLMPNVPTVEESGVPDYDLSGWIGLFAPAGTPAPIIDRLNAEVSRILREPDVRAKLGEIGAEALPMPAAEFGGWVQAEVTKWTKLVREAGIQPE